MRSLFRKINKSESYGNMSPDTDELEDIQRTYDDLVAEVQDFNPIPPVKKNKSDIPEVTTAVTEDEHVEIDLETFQTKVHKEKKRSAKAASRAASSITASDLPQNPRRWGRRARIAFALFVVVGVALAIILIWVFAFSRKKGTTGDGGLVYGPPTFAPTPNWAAANHLIGILVDYTPIEVLLDLNSPQGSAFEALLAREESLSTKTPEFQVIQRYSLLVLYAATGPWRSVAWDVLEPTECNWDGVEGCSLREDDGVMQVETLELASSGLMGTIPTELCLLAGSLANLNLSNNQISGTIPECIVLYTNLVTLDISHNSIAGPLQPLGYSPLLQIANLSHNKLTGTIEGIFAPTNVAPALMGLDLDSNLLTGPVPDVFGGLVGVDSSSIVLTNNLLTGQVPFCRSSLSVDCTEVDCDCCANCL